MEAGRRKLILSALFGAGYVGLKSLATGLPISMFLPETEGTAHADPTPTSPQYLLLLTSGSGDPLNANVPGMYNDPGIYHPTDATMTPTAMTIGGVQTKAAAPWAALPPAILNQTVFFHHGTYTNSHGDAAKVNRLMGAVSRQEMLCSLIAKSLGPTLGTVQSQPMVLNNNLITYSGAVLPVLSPPALKAALLAPTGPLANLQTIRDKYLNQMNARMKQSGNTAQRAILDSYALSQTQARSLNQQLLDDLASVTGNTRADISTATAVLFAMNVSPVAVATFSFGGDNHGDAGLTSEATNTVASVQALVDLTTKIATYPQLANKVTIALQNVFGRTLSPLSRPNNNTDGRDHNSNHHCTVIIGKPFKSALIGGVVSDDAGKYFAATGIDSATGAANAAGDIPYEQTLGSVGKTLCKGVGMDQTTIDTNITLGQVVPAALA